MSELSKQILALKKLNKSLRVHEAEQIIQVDLIVFRTAKRIVYQLLKVQEDFLVRNFAQWELFLFLRWIFTHVFLNIEKATKVSYGIICLPFIDLTFKFAFTRRIHTFTAYRELPGLRFTCWLLANIIAVVVHL